MKPKHLNSIAIGLFVGGFVEIAFTDPRIGAGAAAITMAFVIRDFVKWKTETVKKGKR